MPSRQFNVAPEIVQDKSLLHNHSSAQLLHGVDDLLGLILGDVLLHHLGCALDKLLAVHQAQSEHVLDLLDHLGLGRRLESLELEGEEGLFGGGGSSLLGFLNRGSSGGSGSGESAHGHIGDVELGL